MKVDAPEIILALDVPESSDLPPILESIPDLIRFGKIGLELFCAEGPDALRPLQDLGWRIFLDLKLHDIPRTVERAVRSAARHGVDLLTVHAAGGQAMLEAAVAAAKDFGENRPRLIAVTTLTSMNQDDLACVGIARSLGDQALALADLALSAGIDGLVSSVHEAAALRDRFGPAPLLVTPGIRLPGGEAADQKRIAAPADAVAAGATHLVVGRPILEADDRAAAAALFLENMNQAETQ
jgi:orotidine-5'-phosphate decarboxylase